MKKMIILLAIVFAGITTAEAGNGDKNITSIIKKHLKIPNSLKSSKLDEKVNVEFKIEENGRATILKVETTNPDLKNYIIKQFPTIDFKNEVEKTEGIYFIDINFKVM